MIDFSDCKINKFKKYGGVNGSKIAITYQNEIYMLKFPPKPTKNPMLSYSNSCFSEYISCHIANSIGLKAQETLLGTYHDKIVVACKDFRKDGDEFVDFASLKNSVVDSQTNGRDTTLSEVLFIIDNQDMVDKEELKEFFWDTFILDAYIGNFDRHNGNWGFLSNEKLNTIQIAPIYDCGSCLYPQNTEENFLNILSDKKEIENRIYSFPKSALKNDNGTNINYYTFLTTTDDEDCQKALKKIYNKIDERKINDIIDNTPYITDNYKLFLKTMLHERQEKILLNALKINENLHVKNISNSHMIDAKPQTHKNKRKR